MASREAMDALVKLFSTPKDWSVTKYRAIHENGMAFWIANGPSFFRTDDSKHPISLTYWQRRKLWKLYRKMESASLVHFLSKPTPRGAETRD